MRLSNGTEVIIKLKDGKKARGTITYCFGKNVVNLYLYEVKTEDKVYTILESNIELAPKLEELNDEDMMKVLKHEAKSFKCNNCGKKEEKIIAKSKNTGRIFATCSVCGNVTIIKPKYNNEGQLKFICNDTPQKSSDATRALMEDAFKAYADMDNSPIGASVKSVPFNMAITEEAKTDVIELAKQLEDCVVYGSKEDLAIMFDDSIVEEDSEVKKFIIVTRDNNIITETCTLEDIVEIVNELEDDGDEVYLVIESAKEYKIKRDIKLELIK